MSLIGEVKVANRITSDDLGIETELDGLIDAAKQDLIIAGVDETKVNTLEVDPLIKRAIIIYTKAHFGFDNPDYERLERAYLSLKQHLSLAGDYRAEVE